MVLAGMEEECKLNSHLIVAYAIDENYVPITGISILSLLDNNQSFNDITVYILDNGISSESKEKLKFIVDRYHREVFFLDCTDIGNWLGEEVLNRFHSSWTNVPITSYSRLFLTKLLPEKIEKVLYFDADSMILGDYQRLWNMDCSNYAAMGVLDNVNRDARLKIGLAPDSIYINAGMVLFNLKLLRTIEFDKQVTKFIEKHQGWVYHHDQGIINGVLNDKIGILPPEYNMMSFVYDHKFVKDTIFLYDIPNYYSQEEMDYAKSVPVFIHLLGGYLQRPWVEHCKHPLRKRWEEYRDRTIWKNMPLQADTRSLKLKLLAWINLNLPVTVTKKIIEMVSK